MNCRHCHALLGKAFLDLGFAPPSNAYLKEEDLSAPEVTYPLRLCVCEKCWLVQTEDYASAQGMFDDEYAYFSSTSKSWLKHAAEFSQMITKRLDLSKASLVIEVASNDGYLLRNFCDQNIPCLGIEPTSGTADAAEALGIPVERAFFGEKLAQRLVAQGRKADLIVGNNVFAHVPDINDFTTGLAVALKAEGVITLEFPHLLRLLQDCQFDTVYHEHFSYLSLSATLRIFAKAGLRVFDVEELDTHGGSLRVYGCLDDASYATTANVERTLKAEDASGLNSKTPYDAFQNRAEDIKNSALEYLLNAKRLGKTVAAYGAAAKGNTLLNYAGIKADLLTFVCDAAPSKQNKFLPGSHIPICHPDQLRENRPDVVVILPWNIAPEIREQLVELADQGTRFVTFVPELVEA